MSNGHDNLPVWCADNHGAERELIVNGRRHSIDAYFRFHRDRIAYTFDQVIKPTRQKVVEVGGHPWAMTACLIDHPKFELVATVSAEEVSQWPDDIGLTRHLYEITTPGNHRATFTNYSANIERRVFDIDERPDLVLACEIVEHLIRSPHIMMLNINRWLPKNGRLFLTTPNGAQFSNPMRLKSRSPAFRSSVYGRHNHLFTLELLADLIQLCGFIITDSGWCNVYRRQGLSSMYQVFSRFPSRYCSEKFCQTIYILAEKREDVTELPRVPKVYDGRGQWEFIANNRQLVEAGVEM